MNQSVVKIQADFHMHSSYSDGEATIEAMLSQAFESGRKVAAISDHAAGWEIGGRMHFFFPTLEVYRSYLEEIRVWKDYYAHMGMAVYSALEIEVFSDGTWNLDPGIKAWQERYGDDSLGVDIRIGAVHPESVAEEVATRALWGMPDREHVLMESCVAALREPLFDIVAHPSQAVWSQFQRDFSRAELDYLYSALKERLDVHGPIAIEINCKRRTVAYDNGQAINGPAGDLQFLKRVRDLAVPFVLSSDAHSVRQLCDFETEWVGILGFPLHVATSLAGLKSFARGDYAEGATRTL